MSARDIARRALLESAILRELTAANEDTRHELAADLEPGDRVTVGDLGAVQVTKPRRGWAVVDWPALTRWVERHAPDALLTVTTLKVNPAFIAAVVAAGGEWTDPQTGEILTPDGMGITGGSPQLRVNPSDAATEAARVLLTGWRGELEP